MKGSYLPAIVFLCALLILVQPVSSDLLLPTITHVYFEKDGVPYPEPVHFTVNCYGHCSNPLTSQAQQITGSSPAEIVFSYSATCPDYGCEIYEFNHTHCDIDRCDLVGETRGISFTIPNISNNSELPGCTWLPRKESWFYINGSKETVFLNEYYFVTPESWACGQHAWNKTMNFSSVSRFYRTCDSVPERGCIRMFAGMKPLKEISEPLVVYPDNSVIPEDTEDYITYLETCTPDKDSSCPGWIVDAIPLKTMVEYRPFKNNATMLKDHPCRTFLVKADPSLTIPMTEYEFPYPNWCGGFCNETFIVCEPRFTIPSGTSNTDPVPPKEIHPLDGTESSRTTLAPAGDVSRVPRSPVESLYCSIVELLGGRCD